MRTLTTVEFVTIVLTVYVKMNVRCSINQTDVWTDIDIWKF